MTLLKSKYTFILSLVLGMIFYVSCSDNNIQEEKEQKTEIIDRIDDLTDAIKKKENLSDDEITALELLSMSTGEKNKRYVSTNEYLKESANSKGKNYKTLRSFKEEEKYIEFDDAHGIPFEQLEKAPIFPSCDVKATADELKTCFSNEISNYFNKEFDINVTNKTNLTGENRIFATFIIGKNGKVQNIRARAEHIVLQNEATRVIASLPKMVAGQKNGEDVDVYYTLPITF